MHYDFKLVIEAIIFLVGGMAAYQDILKQKISAKIALLFVVLCLAKSLIIGNVPCFFPFLSVCLIGIGFWFFSKKHVFGDGDYVFFFCSSFLINNSNWYIFITLCGIFGVITSIFFKGKFPFIPAIVLSSLLCQFL